MNSTAHNATPPADSFRAFCVTHRFAMADLATYAADDETDASRLAPILSARSVAELVAARDALQRYLACNALIDAMHEALTQSAGISHRV